MFSNLILKMSLANVGIGHSDNELERLERDEYVMNGFWSWELDFRQAGEDFIS